MLLKQLETYRKIVKLRDGVGVLLRPMTPDDCETLVALYSPASDEDVHYLHHDVREPKIVHAWCNELDLTRVLPLMAMVRERAVGQATLHFHKGPERHVGEVRIFLAKDYRRRGLGTKMMETLIELARKHDLHLLMAEIVTDQAKLIKAFQNLDFERCCTLEDYFMLPDGDIRDVAIMMLRLRTKTGEF